MLKNKKEREIMTYYGSSIADIVLKSAGSTPPPPLEITIAI